MKTLLKTSVFLLFDLALIIWFGNDVAILFEKDTPPSYINASANRDITLERLPSSGKNFETWSRLYALLGQNKVIPRVKGAVTDTYKKMAQVMPSKTFVYGRASLDPSGNSAYIDFMTPVTDEKGGSVPLPGTPFNDFGYDAEFNSAGKYNYLQIDYEALAAHLYYLYDTASEYGIFIREVSFSPNHLNMLDNTEYGSLLYSRINFRRAALTEKFESFYRVEFALDTIAPIAYKN